jgi:hypothetical protein
MLLHGVFPQILQKQINFMSGFLSLLVLCIRHHCLESIVSMLHYSFYHRLCMLSSLSTQQAKMGNDIMTKLSEYGSGWDLF